MKLHSLLYYRYLFRQTLLMAIVLVLLIGIINIVVFSFQNFNLQNYWVFGAIMSIWLFPLINLILVMIYFFKFIKFKKPFKNDLLYLRLKNANIRSAIVKSGTRIKIWLPKSNQVQIFIDAIKPEITKQKKLIAIEKGQY